NERIGGTPGGRRSVGWTLDAHCKRWAAKEQRAGGGRWGGGGDGGGPSALNSLSEFGGEKLGGGVAVVIKHHPRFDQVEFQHPPVVGAKGDSEVRPRRLVLVQARRRPLLHQAGGEAERS